MHHYRQALLRMRLGESDREIAAARLMGRRKAAQWRELATALGWLDVQQPLPDDEAIATALGEPRRASTTISTLEPHRALLSAWVEQGVSGAAIHAALKRQHAWAGSYSAVRRLLADIRAHLPPETTCRLDFDPGDAAQVDFGAGPTLIHPDGLPRRTWAFVMTLAHSRHQYVEFVWDQTVATWLGCHRRAFEWLAGVPARVIIDNAKCAITRACAQDPTVQRAYAECAEGYGFKIDACPPHDPQKTGVPKKLASWGGVRASSRPASNTSRATSCRCASSATWPTSTRRPRPGSCKRLAFAAMARPGAARWNSSPWNNLCFKACQPSHPTWAHGTG